MPVCKECYEHRTDNPSGICAICWRRGAKAPSLIARFAAEVYIEKPFPAALQLPCESRPTEFDKPKASQRARDMCAECPREAYDWCLSWGMANDEQGIWGGLSRDERRTVHAGLPDRMTERADLTQGHYTLVA